MNSEKVKEVKQALECCQGESLKSCEPCPYWNMCKEDDGLTFKNETLTLINELESENERLKETVSELSGIIKIHKFCVGANHCQNSSTREMELKDRIAELEKENEELKQKSIDILKKMLDDFNKNAEKEIENLEREIVNLLKQFAERIKMEFYYEFDEIIPSIMASKIDETLNEFLKEKSNE